MIKVAVVSGASYGIGEAISRELLGKNFKVYGISRSVPKISDSKFVWLKADLLDQKQLDSISKMVEEDSVDMLVNNAGTSFSESALEFKDEHFDTIFGLNFKAPIKLTLALMRKLTGGLIVNVSSLADRFPDGLYGSSKAALNNYLCVQVVLIV